MMESSKKRAFVIAKAHGTNDFVRFSNYMKSVELHFPLMSDRQKNMEETFTSIAKEMNLKVAKRRAGGEAFLDIYLKGTAAEVSATA